MKQANFPNYFSPECIIFNNIQAIKIAKSFSIIDPIGSIPIADKEHYFDEKSS